MHSLIRGRGKISTAFADFARRRANILLPHLSGRKLKKPSNAEIIADGEQANTTENSVKADTTGPNLVTNANKPY